MSTNFLTVIGFAAIVTDPKIIESTNGGQCFAASVAARDFFLDKNGIAQTNVTYIDIEYWTSPDVIKNLNLKKGDIVEFKGKLNESQWESKETTEKRKKHYVKIKLLKKHEEKNEYQL